MARNIFAVRDPGFARVMAEWEAEGIATLWPDAGEQAWVGTPAMNAPVKAMAARHEVSWGTRIAELRKSGDAWLLLDESGETVATADAALVAIPAEQAADLLAPVHSEFAAIAMQTVSDPCWTAMLAFADSLASDTVILRDDNVIGWAARNSAKPGRSGPESWVVQAGPDWSRAHLEDASEAVLDSLSARLASLLAIDLPTPVAATAHRWRFARSGSAGREALYEEAARLGVCGDWLIGPRVECAWVSGYVLGGMAATG